MHFPRPHLDACREMAVSFIRSPQVGTQQGIRSVNFIYSPPDHHGVNSGTRFGSDDNTRSTLDWCCTVDNTPAPAFNSSLPSRRCAGRYAPGHCKVGTVGMAFAFLLPRQQTLSPASAQCSLAPREDPTPFHSPRRRLAGPQASSSRAWWARPLAEYPLTPS